MFNECPQLKVTDVGIGFRPAYYRELLDRPSSVECLEIMTDDYLGVGGAALFQLSHLQESFPLVLHGVSLSLAGTDPLDKGYVKQVKELASRIAAVHISDHLCWTGVQGRHAFDLLPFPWNQESLSHVASRINQVQDLLQCQLVVENLSQYMTFKSSDLSEQEFWLQLLKRTGCGLLLDVNNVYVNSQNLGYSAEDFLDAIPPGSIKQYHLAGHRNQHGLCIDTHDTEVATSVYRLYRRAWERIPAPTILERDSELPALADLEKELSLIKACHDSSGVVCR